MVHDALVSLLSAVQDPDHFRDLVLQEAQFAHSSFLPLLLPKSINFRPKFGEFLLLLLSSDHWHFGQVNNLPIANNFLLNIFVLIISLFFLLVLLGLSFLIGLLLLEHS
jgi:hypothetical protein